MRRLCGSHLDQSKALIVGGNQIGDPGCQYVQLHRYATNYDPHRLGQTQRPSLAVKGFRPADVLPL